MSDLPGSMTVYVMEQALVSSGVPTWHLPGRTTEEPWRWLTLCGRVIADRPTWHAVAIRRLFAGTFAVPCGTCLRAEDAQKRRRS